MTTRGPLKADRVGVIVRCAVCGRSKKPIGRSGPLEASYCDEDCTGYQTPWLVRRDVVREAGRQLAASVSHQQEARRLVESRCAFNCDAESVCNCEAHRAHRASHQQEPPQESK